MDEMANFFSGGALYGDDFTPEEVAAWVRDEEQAYYEVTLSNYGSYDYAYHAMNIHYAYSKLRGLSFKTCLAFGCATGDDVAPLAAQVGQYVCVEPAERFWRQNIGGKPARFLKPTASGVLPVETGSIDLVVSLGVLHHLPNVTFVLSELVRVLASDGLLILREPICTMGDWRNPRPGLTKHERGIPLQYLRERLHALHLTPLRQSLCSFPLVPRIAMLIRIRHAYNSRPLVLLDHLLSWSLRWNLHYHRNSIFKKLAPSEVFLVASKRQP
jgi:SAM-dependent methyltransferase